MNRYLLYLFLLILGGQIEARGQQLQTIPPSLEEHVNAYFSTTSNQSIIYSGKEEGKYASYMLNHPYLYTNEYKAGSLSFDGVIYPDVKLRLNLHTQELIILSPDGRFNVIVPTNRVDYATIGKYFIFYNLPKIGIADLSEGYYTRLHDGKYPVLKRETCFIQSMIKDMKIEASFERKNRLYVYKDGKYNTVGSKGAVLKLFKSNKKELKKFIKENELNYRRSPDDFVVAVIEHYETITQ